MEGTNPLCINEQSYTVSPLNSALDGEEVEAIFGGIVGTSPALKTAFDLGIPSGAYKFERADPGRDGNWQRTHRARDPQPQSAAVTRTFVKLNCAAIPFGLLESELFGHEKGAFTGSHRAKGRDALNLQTEAHSSWTR